MKAKRGDRLVRQLFGSDLGTPDSAGGSEASSASQLVPLDTTPGRSEADRTQNQYTTPQRPALNALAVAAFPSSPFTPAKAKSSPTIVDVLAPNCSGLRVLQCGACNVTSAKRRWAYPDKGLQCWPCTNVHVALADTPTDSWSNWCTELNQFMGPKFANFFLNLDLALVGYVQGKQRVRFVVDIAQRFLEWPCRQALASVSAQVSQQSEGVVTIDFAAYLKIFCSKHTESMSREHHLITTESLRVCVEVPVDQINFLVADSERNFLQVRLDSAGRSTAHDIIPPAENSDEEDVLPAKKKRGNASVTGGARTALNRFGKIEREFESLKPRQIAAFLRAGDNLCKNLAKSLQNLASLRMRGPLETELIRNTKHASMNTDLMLQLATLWSAYLETPDADEEFLSGATLVAEKLRFVSHRHLPPMLAQELVYIRASKVLMESGGFQQVIHLLSDRYLCETVPKAHAEGNETFQRSAYSRLFAQVEKLTTSPEEFRLQLVEFLSGFDDSPRDPTDTASTEVPLALADLPVGAEATQQAGADHADVDMAFELSDEEPFEIDEAPQPSEEGLQQQDSPSHICHDRLRYSDCMQRDLLKILRVADPQEKFLESTKGHLEDIQTSADEMMSVLCESKAFKNVVKRCRRWLETTELKNNFIGNLGVRLDEVTSIVAWVQAGRKLISSEGFSWEDFDAWMKQQDIASGTARITDIGKEVGGITVGVSDPALKTCALITKAGERWFVEVAELGRSVWMP